MSALRLFALLFAIAIVAVAQEPPKTREDPNTSTGGVAGDSRREKLDVSLQSGREALGREQGDAALALFVSAIENARELNESRAEGDALIGALAALDLILSKNDTRNDTGSALEAAERVRTADAYYHAVEKLGEGRNIQYARNLAGLIHLRAGEPKRALELLSALDDSAVEANERFVFGFNAGRALEVNGLPDQAEQKYRTVISSRPDYEPAVEALMRVYDAEAKRTSPRAVAVCSELLRGGKAPKSTALCIRTLLSKWPNDSAALVLAVEYNQSVDPALSNADSFLASAPSELRQRLHDILDAPNRLVGGKAKDFLPREFFDESGEPSANASKWFEVMGRALEYRDADDAAAAAFALAFEFDTNNADALEHLSHASESAASQVVPLIYPASKQWTEIAHTDPDMARRLFNAAAGIVVRVSPCLTAGTRTRAILQTAVDLQKRTENFSPDLQREYVRCLSDSSEAQAATDARKDLRSMLAGQHSFMTPAEKWKYFGQRSYYLGGWLKSVAQAGVLLLLHSPEEWGQGAKGYGQRLASSQAARSIRQMMSAQLTIVQGVEPRFTRSDKRGVWARTRSVLLQEVRSHDDVMGWHPALWRWASAYGSELTSNAWRPRGPGIGSNNGTAWLVRGSLVLVGDITSNMMREFLPRKYWIGRLIGVFF